MSERERIQRGERAQKILDSDEWRDAWASYREMLLHEIETVADDQRALEARRLLKAARKAREHLESLIADAAIAKADIASRKSNLRIT